MRDYNTDNNLIMITIRVDMFVLTCEWALCGDISCTALVIC